MVIVKTKEWGNSIGVVVPSELVKGLGIKPNEEINIEVSKKSNVLKDLWGSGKFKKQTDKMLQELRGMESKHL